MAHTSPKFVKDERKIKGEYLELVFSIFSLTEKEYFDFFLRRFYFVRLETTTAFKKSYLHDC